MHYTVLIGTARPGRMSEHVARFVCGTLEGASHTVEFVDVRDYLGITNALGGALPEDDIGTKWKTIVARSEPLLIVTPEYNHSFPGELKRLLDGAYAEYMNKPIGIIGVSGGPLGGARMCEHLQSVLTSVGARLPKAGLFFPMVQQLFDEHGKIRDDAYVGKVLAFVEQLK